MTSILDGALERRPFAGEGGRTDATFERAVLSDGREVVIKHVTTASLVAEDPAIREQERADLDWWIARVREALETWSPV